MVSSIGEFASRRAHLLRREADGGGNHRARRAWQCPAGVDGRRVVGARKFVTANSTVALLASAISYRGK